MQHATQIPGFIKSLEPLITHYGYLGVGGLIFAEDFGLPVPGETVLIAAAFYAGFGKLNIVLIILIGILAGILGDNTGFAIGKFGGHPLIEKIGKYVFLTPARIKKIEDLFKRQGPKIVVIARFVEGLRQANGIIAGLSGMRWLSFLFFNVIGATLWVIFWALIGYFGGSHIETFIHFQTYFSIAVVVALLIYLPYRIKHKRAEKAAESAVTK
jgi:membrane protein DedA with SNARE-associated domain